MGFPWSETTNGVIAALAAAAAGGSWKAAHRSSATADAVARIERERWHADLTPQFDITLAQTGASVAYLTVHLEGPDHLKELDEVTPVREQRRPTTTPSSGARTASSHAPTERMNTAGARPRSHWS